MKSKYTIRNQRDQDTQAVQLFKGQGRDGRKEAVRQAEAGMAACNSHLLCEIGLMSHISCKMG